MSSGDVLEVIAQYLYHAEKYKDVKDPPDLDIPLEVVLDLLLAAEYLNCEMTLQCSFIT